MTAPQPDTFVDPLFDISGKVYLVAGAGGGLGGPIAEELARRGAKLVLFDIDEEALARVGKAIPDAVARVADMTDESAVDDLVALAATRFGRIDGALNAAGTLPIAPADSLEEAVFRDCLDVNVTGAFLFSRSVAKALDDGGGRIVHIASVSSYVSNPAYAAYSSSKAALAQLVRVLGREWATRNILVNAIGPAVTATPLTYDYLADETFKRNALSVIPMGRFGEPEDLIGTVLLLLSKAGAFITGQTIYVDGGRTLA
jgi:NAD(P)-dependent dehydrogenase (short-subunit alcohol dehydrogenase family)